MPYSLKSSTSSSTFLILRISLSNLYINKISILRVYIVYKLLHCWSFESAARKALIIYINDIILHIDLLHPRKNSCARLALVVDTLTYIAAFMYYFPLRTIFSVT